MTCEMAAIQFEGVTSYPLQPVIINFDIKHLIDDEGMYIPYTSLQLVASLMRGWHEFSS